MPNGDISPEIIFWEKNGLRHGEFQLPGAGKDCKTHVYGLKYNIESSLLAVHLKLDPGAQINNKGFEHWKDKDGIEVVMIFTRSNWKWFCKQTIRVRTPLKSLIWLKKY